MQHASEQKLVMRMARGDEAAFGAIWSDHQGSLYRFAWHMTGDAAAAEEITQDVFLALLEKPGGFDGSRGPLSAYLFGIARNLLRRRFRDVGFEPIGEGDDVPADFVDPEDAVPVEAVRAAVLSLPAVYREAIALCDLQEASYEEASRILGVAIGTVRSRLFRGRQLLGMKLKGTVRV